MEYRQVLTGWGLFVIFTGMQRLYRWLFFNLKYAGNPPWDTGISPPELKAFIDSHPAGRALDLGCGTGTNLVTLAKAGWTVTGVDFALRAVIEARRKLKRAGLSGSVSVGDVTRLTGMDEIFNLVLDIGCFHGLQVGGKARYQEQLEGLLDEEGYYMLYVHLKSGGQPRAMGASEDELGAFERFLETVWRQDSLDRWGRKAAWLLFQRKLPLDGRGG